MAEAVKSHAGEEFAPKEIVPVAAESDWALRWRSAARLARREIAAALNSLPLYMMITLACLVASVVMTSYLNYVGDNGTMVLANPLSAPVLFAVLVSNAFLCLTAAAGLAGERERGTLEVLFYGPVDSTVYIVGKLLGYLSIYGVAMAALLIFLALAAQLSGMRLDGITVLLLISSILPAAAMIALGMLLAALVGRLRPAVALTAVVLILFVAIDAGNQIAATQPSDTMLGGAATLLAQVAALVEWVSPFGYIWRAADAFSLQNTAQVLLGMGIATLYSVLLTALAIFTLTRRGVQRWRE